MVSLLWVTYPENAKIFFKKLVSLLWATYLGKNMENGLIVTSDLPEKHDERWSYYNRRPTQMKFDEKQSYYNGCPTQENW